MKIKLKLPDKKKIKALMHAQCWMEAKKLCAVLCRQSKSDAEGWHLQGIILGQLEAHAESEQSFRKAATLRDDEPAVHYNMGIALQKQAKFGAAAGCFRKVISLAPQYAEAYNELGASLRRQGEDGNAEAVEFFLKALSLKPELTVAQYNLAVAQMDLGRNHEALAHLQQVVALHPRLVKAQEALGLLLRKMGLLHEAVSHYQNALQYFPDELPLILEFGYSLKDLGELDEAKEKYHYVLELQPGNVDALAGLAQIADRQGKFEESHELLRPFLGNCNVNVALAYASVAKHLGLQGEAVSLCERLLSEDKSDSGRRLLHHSLGQLYDDTQEYDLAFRHFKSANKLVGGGFNLEKKGELFTRLQTVFNAEGLARLPRASNNSALPIFIVGMPRSGTSLVEQILASHPDVYGAGELSHLAYIEAKLPDITSEGTSYPDCVQHLKPQNVDALADEYLQKLAGYSANSCRVTDKMPHNFMRLGLIDLLFPGSCIIHCLRDPLDTCLSIYSLPFNHNHLYATDLSVLGEYYQLYLRLMAHWKTSVRVPILEVRYEDLVADYETMTCEITKFCRLPWDDACLRFYSVERTVHTPSYDQVRRPIYNKSVGRWRHYAKHLEPLIKALGTDAYATKK